MPEMYHLNLVGALTKWTNVSINVIYRASSWHIHKILHPVLFLLVCVQITLWCSLHVASQLLILQPQDMCIRNVQSTPKYSSRVEGMKGELAIWKRSAITFFILCLIYMEEIDVALNDLRFYSMCTTFLSTGQVFWSVLEFHLLNMSNHWVWRLAFLDFFICLYVCNLYAVHTYQTQYYTVYIIISSI